VKRYTALFPHHSSVEPQGSAKKLWNICWLIKNSEITQKIKNIPENIVGIFNWKLKIME
jgi:hypothetical protein